MAGIARPPAASRAAGVTVSGQVPSATGPAVSGVADDYTLTVTAEVDVSPTGAVTFTDASDGNAVLAMAARDSRTAAAGFAGSRYVVGSHPFAAADFNGDGKRDLVVAKYGSNTMSVLLNLRSVRAACLTLLMAPACGGGGNNDPGTTTGSYTVTLTAGTGSYAASISVPLTAQPGS